MNPELHAQYMFKCNSGFNAICQSVLEILARAEKQYRSHELYDLDDVTSMTHAILVV